jgi:putative ABC transport system ATP-binding protein
MSALLKAERLNKTYFLSKQNKHHVLNNIDLDIQNGEFVALMGPSGSGKSTLLYNLSCMDKATSGRVIFEGKALSLMSENELADIRLRKMGFIFQQINLIKNLSILDNILLPGYLAKKHDRGTVLKKANELMGKVGIDHLAMHDITQASGGQLQRVAICRALVNNPDIIFGDEPTGALNSKSANDIMDIIDDIHQSGTTIILATHDIKVAARAGRVIYLLDGEIVSEKHQGKRVVNEDSQREKALMAWLMSLGF